MPTLKPIISYEEKMKKRNNSKFIENHGRSKYPDPSQLYDPHLECLNGEMMAISQDDADKYFGEESRIIFFEQYRKMCNATMHIATNVSSSIQTDENDVDLSDNDDDDDDDDESENQSSSSSSMRMKSKRLDNFDDGSNISKITTIMNSLSTEFYTQLQSSVSKEKLNLEIDKELLSYNSFKLYQGRPFVKKVFHLEPIENVNNNYNNINNNNNNNINNNSNYNADVPINKSKTTSKMITNRSYKNNNSKNSLTNISIPMNNNDDASSVGDLTMNTSTELLSTLVLASPRTKYISGII